MTIMNRDQARRIMDKVLGYSKSDECEVNLNGQITGNVRYALNTVTTAGVTEDVTLTVTSAYGKKSGASTVNQFDDKSLKRAVETAEELASLSPENEEYMPRLEQQKYLEGHGHFESTAAISPEFRAKAAADSIGPSREKGLTAAGFLNDSNNFQAMANSKGLFASYDSTGVSFSTTIRTADRTGTDVPPGEGGEGGRPRYRHPPGERGFLHYSSRSGPQVGLRAGRDPGPRCLLPPGRLLRV